MATSAAHFRAHDRRVVRVSVEILPAEAQGSARTAVVVDLSLGGAGLETEEALVVGERIRIALATPAMWDLLLVDAVVAWAHAARPAAGLDAVGRSRSVARSGVVFHYPEPAIVLAMHDLLATVGFE